MYNTLPLGKNWNWPHQKRKYMSCGAFSDFPARAGLSGVRKSKNTGDSVFGGKLTVSDNSF